MSELQRLVFTDLDGTLLDHHSYSFEAALPMIKELAELQIPLIPTTSKTKAELILIRQALHNQHPFITENGAAVYIPKGYFKVQPKGTEVQDNYWVKGFALPRTEWRRVLNNLPETLQGCFTSFHDLGDEGIALETGLRLEEAHLANQRDYSEPLVWTGNDAEKAIFKTCLQEQSIQVLEGGRFIHLSTGYTKGKAMLWLSECYKQETGLDVVTLALGDGGNDIPMLELADIAVVIKRPDQKKIHPEAKELWYSDLCGPEGWNQTVERFLKRQKLTPW